MRHVHTGHVPTLALCLLLAAPAGAGGPPCFDATAWTEADALFTGDRHWLGADGASTVALGDGRVLWLFGDTWIDASGSADRRRADMVSNSVAIQEGSDPSSARIRFYWGEPGGADVGPLFPDRGGESLWPGHGVQVAGRLVVFFARTVRGTGTGLGFEHVGWTAALIENPGDEPPAWRVRWLGDFGAPARILAGYAEALVLGDHVYAFGVRSPEMPQAVYALRWRLARVIEGDLLDPEGWAGEGAGWVAAGDEARLAPVFRDAQTELSIHGHSAPVNSSPSSRSASDRPCWRCGLRRSSPGPGRTLSLSTSHPSARGPTS